MAVDQQTAARASQPGVAARVGLRLGAAAAAFPLAAAATVVAVIAWLLSGHVAQVPNAYDSGREYGSAPDTWAGTVVGVAGTTGVMFVAMAMLTGVGALLGFAVTGRWLSRRGWLVAPSAFTAVVFVALLASLYVDRGNAQPFTDCASFRLDRAAFTSTDERRWRLQTRGLADCNMLDGLSRAQIEAKLGPDEKDEYSSLSYHGGQLVIEFREDDVDGRPSSVWAW